MVKEIYIRTNCFYRQDSAQICLNPLFSLLRHTYGKGTLMKDILMKRHTYEKTHLWTRHTYPQEPLPRNIKTALTCRGSCPGCRSISSCVGRRHCLTQDLLLPNSSHITQADSPFMQLQLNLNFDFNFDSSTLLCNISLLSSASTFVWHKISSSYITQADSPFMQL